jgi:hypothetical protein
MTSYDDWFEPSKFFKADDVVDNPLYLTIARLDTEEIRKGGAVRKPCVFFNEDERLLGLNRTNMTFLKKVTGSSNPKDAIGLRVVLRAVDTEYEGRDVKGIRLELDDRPAPDEQDPEPLLGGLLGGDNVPF